MAIAKGTSGAIWIVDSSTAFTTLPMTSAGGAIYQLNDTAKRIWDPNVTVSFTAGTIDASWMDEGVDYFTGRVKMTATGLTVSVTGAYLVITQAGSIFSWNLAGGTNAQEITAIGETWKSFTSVENSHTLTLERYYYDTRFWSHLNATAPLTLIQVYEDATYGFWLKVLPQQFAVNVAVNTVTREPLAFQGTAIPARF